MRLQQQIQINELLLEREALFVRIHEIERQLDALLGEPYPLSRPRLPSDQKARRKAPAGRPAATTKPTLPLKLEDRESGYLITYKDGECLRAEQHVNPQALETLLAAQTHSLVVIRVETVDHNGSVLRLLLDHAQETPPPASCKTIE